MGWQGCNVRCVATEGDVERIASGLPDVAEGTTFRNRCWKVHGKTFVWMRPLSATDRRQLGDGVPSGPTIAVRVADDLDKVAVLQQYDATFDIEHFATFDAVLIALDDVDVDALEELIVDAWMCMAPSALVAGVRADEADRSPRRIAHEE